MSQALDLACRRPQFLNAAMTSGRQDKRHASKYQMQMTFLQIIPYLSSRPGLYCYFYYCRYHCIYSLASHIDSLQDGLGLIRNASSLPQDLPMHSRLLSWSLHTTYIYSLTSTAILYNISRTCNWYLKQTDSACHKCEQMSIYPSVSRTSSTSFVYRVCNRGKINPDWSAAQCRSLQLKDLPDIVEAPRFIFVVLYCSCMMWSVFSLTIMSKNMKRTHAAGL